MNADENCHTYTKPIRALGFPTALEGGLIKPEQSAGVFENSSYKAQWIRPQVISCPTL